MRCVKFFAKFANIYMFALTFLLNTFGNGLVFIKVEYVLRRCFDKIVCGECNESYFMVEL